MIENSVKTFEYENGEIQRVWCLTPGSWNFADFFEPKPSFEAFKKITDLYRDFTVPKCPIIFGRLLHFCLPEGYVLPKEVNDVLESDAVIKKYGRVCEPVTGAAIALREGVRLTRKGKPVFKLPSLKDFYEDLKEMGCLKVVCGKAPYTKILPVGNKFGLLSESAGDLSGVLNSSFFIMDSFDVASSYDVIGTAFGLTVKDGQVLNPPLYKREALLVKKANDTTPGEVLV
ncbi:MAG: hypothetical protein K6B75_04780, partial [Lachnospiraceae bacterium]|nr:hypothetical protein [Lachnospiraceae bacterium]